MSLFKLLAAGCLATACFWFVDISALAQTANSVARPVLKPAKARGSHPRAALAENAATPAPSVIRCVAGWYGTSGMSRGEWRKACERAPVDGGIPQDKALSVCVNAWDPVTHMSKQEWRAACQRSVQQDPGAFQR
jgi:hypothetical protein